MNTTNKPSPRISAQDRFATGWLSLTAAATFAGVTAGTIRRWVFVGTNHSLPLPHGRFGKRIRVHEMDLRDWLGEVEQAAAKRRGGSQVPDVS